MAKDLSQTLWHGVPRQNIPWFPVIDSEKCIGCELCYITCGREVYEITPDDRHKAKTERPYNCMVGCSTCAMVCPTQAITFPTREVVWKIEREYKIFKEVRKEAEVKRSKTTVTQERKEADKKLDGIATRAQVRIAGTFGEKQFLAKLEGLIKSRPFDITDLQLSVPTVKGLLEKTPAYMSFYITSTQMEDVHSLVDELKEMVYANDLTWVEATYS